MKMTMVVKVRLWWEKERELLAKHKIYYLIDSGAPTGFTLAAVGAGFLSADQHLFDASESQFILSSCQLPMIFRYL